MPQSFDNHAHRPLLTTAAGFAWTVALVALVWGGVGFNAQTIFAVGLLASVLALIFASRAYIVRLQDRIILLEMKVRAAEVLPAGHDARLAQLTKGQIVALRFAPDAELEDLLDRALREKLTAKEIKRAIKNWRPDLLRT